MLAYYNTSPPTCQPLFKKKINYFNLPPSFLSFSRVFGLFCASNAIENSFFQARKYMKKEMKKTVHFPSPVSCPLNHEKNMSKK